MFLQSTASSLGPHLPPRELLVCLCSTVLQLYIYLTLYLFTGFNRYKVIQGVCPRMYLNLTINNFLSFPLHLIHPSTTI